MPNTEFIDDTRDTDHEFEGFLAPQNRWEAGSFLGEGGEESTLSESNVPVIATPPRAITSTSGTDEVKTVLSIVEKIRAKSSLTKSEMAEELHHILKVFGGSEEHINDTKGKGKEKEKEREKEDEISKDKGKAKVKDSQLKTKSLREAEGDMLRVSMIRNVLNWLREECTKQGKKVRMF